MTAAIAAIICSSVIGDAFAGIFVALAAEVHDGVLHGAAEPAVFLFVATLQRLKFREAGIFQVRRLAAEPLRFLVIERTHVGLGDRSRRAQNAFLAATRAGAVAGHERFVIAPHHEVIAQGGFARIRRIHVVVKPEEFLRRVGQEPRENLRGSQLGVELLGLGGHAQGIVVAADLDAFAAALAKVGNENGEQSAGAGGLRFE
jgi:hypothetical protein